MAVDISRWQKRSRKVGVYPTLPYPTLPYTSGGHSGTKEEEENKDGGMGF
jgi:hypothetical protein